MPWNFEAHPQLGHQSVWPLTLFGVLTASNANLGPVGVAKGPGVWGAVEGEF
jgi:hypothetical protein